jgi:hypothetical protein
VTLSPAWQAVSAEWGIAFCSHLRLTQRQLPSMM